MQNGKRDDPKCWGDVGMHASERKLAHLSEKGIVVGERHRHGSIRGITLNLILLETGPEHKRHLNSGPWKSLYQTKMSIGSF